PQTISGSTWLLSALGLINDVSRSRLLIAESSTSKPLTWRSTASQAWISQATRSILGCSGGLAEVRMRVRLKGINHATKRLSNGTIRHYWYAWRGGPLLRGEPGTPEFIASYNEAAAGKVTAPEGVLSALIGKFETSPEFEKLAPRT